MANHHDFQRSSYKMSDDDLYRPSSSGLGILIAIGILAVLVLGLLLLNRPNTDGVRSTAPTPQVTTPDTPTPNGTNPQ